MSPKINETKIKKLARKATQTSFYKFLEGPYKVGFENTEPGDITFVTWDSKDSFLYQLSTRLIENNRTVTIGPRLHSKSSVFGAYALWKMATADADLDIIYMHYKEKKAGQLIRNKVKRIYQNSPLLKYLFKTLTNAKTKVEIKNRITDARCTVEPAGLLGSERSSHCDVLLVDDPLKSEQTNLEGARTTPTKVKQATQRFFETAMGLPKRKTGELHVISTAISENDLLHQLMDRDNFDADKVPAVKNAQFNDNETKVVDGELVWPEYYQDLDMINDILDDYGPRAFKKELLCEPGKKVDSFLHLDNLKGCFGYDAADRPPIETVVGGHDIGKKVHPSHAILFVLDEDGEMWEIKSKWMPAGKWDYNKQVDWWLKQVNCEEGGYCLPLALGFYDNSRSEFEALEEQGLLPDNFKPLGLSSGPVRSKAASELDRRVNQGTIHFQYDRTNYKQMANVDAELRAPEMNGRHSDCFWSAAMAAYAASKVEGKRQKLFVPNIKETNESLKGKSRWKRNKPGRRNSL